MEHEVYLNQFLEESIKLGSKHEGGVEGMRAAWEYLQDVDQITPFDVISVHAKIVGVDPEEHDFRDEGAMYGHFSFADPYYMVNAKMKAWCRTANVPPGKKLYDDAKIKCMLYRQIQFGKIHPFKKANGQVARLLFLWACEKYHLPIWTFDHTKGMEYMQSFVNYNNEDDDKVGIKFDKYMRYVCENPCL